MELTDLTGEDSPKEDHHVHLRLNWADYERLLATKGEQSIPRFHCIERDIDVIGAGSWTIKKRRRKAAAEPDECYVFGGRKPGDRPDLVIEVMWTSGSLDKLDIYSRLEVPEVWLWHKGRIQMFRLRGERYRRSARSQFVPELDPNFLCGFLDRPTVNRAERDFRKALKKSGH